MGSASAMESTISRPLKIPASVTPLVAAPEEVKVLIVDDDPLCVTLCKRYLAKSTKLQFQVHTESTGAAALERLESEEFDCLVIDYYLPDFNGTEVLEKLHGSDEELMIPAIILTANGGEKAAIGAVRAGASDYLPKSALSRASLSRAINNAVSNSRLKRSVAAQRRELQIANKKLLLQNEEINRFYHHVSHEVKTPLCALREFVSIVRDGVVGDVNDEQIEILEHALDSCDQIHSHFNDLVEMTRLEARKVKINKTPTRLHDVMEHCSAAFAGQISEGKIQFSADVADDLPMVNLDRHRTIQVMSNLIGNAVKFTPEGGRIAARIDVADDPAWILMTVEDNGCGIPGEHLERIFDRLYQVKHRVDNNSGAGLGLGLSIVKEVIELHGGSISVDSEVGKGTRFEVRLPLEPAVIN